MIAVLMPITPAGAVHERAAAIAGIKRRVGLDHVLDQPAGLAAQRPVQRADHAGRDRRLQAKRIADRDHELADPKRTGIADVGRQAAAPKPQQREVRIRILAHDAGLDTGAVGQDRVEPRGRARRDRWSGRSRRA